MVSIRVLAITVMLTSGVAYAGPPHFDFDSAVVGVQEPAFSTGTSTRRARRYAEHQVDVSFCTPLADAVLLAAPFQPLHSALCEGNVLVTLQFRLNEWTEFPDGTYQGPMSWVNYYIPIRHPTTTRLELLISPALAVDEVEITQKAGIRLYSMEVRDAGGDTLTVKVTASGTLSEVRQDPVKFSNGVPVPFRAQDSHASFFVSLAAFQTAFPATETNVQVVAKMAHIIRFPHGLLPLGQARSVITVRTPSERQVFQE